MADKTKTPAGTEKEKSENTTTAPAITSRLLDQLPYDRSHVLNTFLNIDRASSGQSDRPFNGIETMESLDARIGRIRARLQDFDAQLGSRKEQSRPK